MGKIRKLYDQKLVGERGTEEVFPITASRAVYDTNGKPISESKAESSAVAPLWVAGTSYSVGSLVMYNGALYKCTTANSSATWNPSYWTPTNAVSEGGGGGGGSYTGGEGINITGNVIKVNPATSNTLGGVKQGTGITIADDGTISANNPESSMFVLEGEGTTESPYRIKAKYSLYSIGGITAGGIGSGGSGGSSVEWEQIQPETGSTLIAQITINGTTTDVYAPSTGSSYEPGNGISIENNEISVLPASTTQFGGVKIGTGLEVVNGFLRTTGGGGGSYTSGEGILIDESNRINVKAASSSELGGVFKGDGININNSGQISVAPANGSTLGGVYAGDNITIVNGKISATGGSSGGVTSVNNRAGAVILSKSDVGLENVDNTKLSTWTGSSNITTVGTIGTGTWEGNEIEDDYIASSSDWNAAATAIVALQALFNEMFEKVDSRIHAKLPLFCNSGITAGGKDTVNGILINTTIPSEGAVSGIMYNLSQITADRTITLDSPGSSNIVKEWMFQFSIDSTARTITFTDGIWSSQPISFTANKTYQVRITLVGDAYLCKSTEF